jgi:6-phosphogluconate dehydrogenase
MSNSEMADLFDEWNKGELESYLIEITAKVLRKKDDQGKEGEVVDYILSGRKQEREEAEMVLEGPKDKPNVDQNQIIKDLQEALYCSKIVSYAQGLSIIKAASDKYEWNVDLALCARMWRGGCIIRARLLKGISDAVGKNDDLKNLMVDPGFAEELNSRHMAWRRVVTLGISHGISVPSTSASLGYYDQYRRGRLPANLVQGLRDFFGGHTYERIDKEGTFHTLWDASHKDLGDLSGRRAGEV